MEHINNYINKHKDRFINELIELLKIPSISADPNYKQDVLNCVIKSAKSMESKLVPTILKSVRHQDILLFMLKKL